jgi:hypothetical protein
MSEPDPPPSPAIPNNDSVNAAAPLLGYASGIHYPVAADTPGEAFREGPTLICANGITLPPRCVLCGQPGAGAAIRLTLTWDSTFRITRQSTLELRKKASVHAFLCAKHRQKWARARSIGGIGFVIALSLMFAGSTLAVWSESSDIPLYTPHGLALTIIGFAIAIVALFFFTLRSHTLSCSKIQEGYLYLEGAADPFLETLPSVPENPPNPQPPSNQNP